MRLVHLLLLFMSLSIFSEELSPEIRKLPPTSMSGDIGHKINGDEWKSTEFQKKVTIVFYVDPDKKDVNEHVGEALSKEQFDLKNYQSYAIINMDATMTPNFILNSILSKKQKKYPNTIYVKDFTKHLVKTWNLQDDQSHILLFDKSGRLIFEQYDKLNDKSVNELINLIKENMKK
ncbi:MAG: transcriptional regulator [Halobacteriovoraceae bacterium]|nr:transcriptional regulator [Halobacteriovoraceae bacterium]